MGLFSSPLDLHLLSLCTHPHRFAQRLFFSVCRGPCLQLFAKLEASGPQVQ